MNAGGDAVCTKCGLNYSIERLRELMDPSKPCESVSMGQSPKEDASYYVKDYSEEELAQLEGRVGDYFGSDLRTAEMLRQDVREYLSSSIFSDYEIEEMIPAEKFGANRKCMPVDFMLKKNGKPIIAILILRSARRSHGAVTGTISAVSDNNIKYLGLTVGMPNTEFYIKRKILKIIGY